MRRSRILQGDVLDQLASLPDESVQCVVTSPPYWGLRDYGVAGQIGLEPTPEEYVAKMVEVFREVRRVLRSDGTCWLNLGDSYAANRSYQVPDSKWVDVGNSKGMKASEIGLKPKDLVGIPWMVAFALRADGWWLRADNPWGKPNGMPESVIDRPTRAHEYVFLLAKSERYYYDAEAVRTAPKASTETRLKQDIENQAGSSRANGGEKTNGPMKAVGRGLTGGAYAPPGQAPHGKARTDKQRGHSRRHQGFNDRWYAMTVEEQMADGANLRSIWWISPAQYAEAHFAVMPEKLAQICILAGTKPGDTVLDPFTGSGTVGVVALRYQRNFVGIELNPEYVALAERRIIGDAPLFNGPAAPLSPPDASEPDVHSGQ